VPPPTARSVSVVIPAYNAEAFLAEAVESALSQTEPPHEVIVVNDGSTDGTAAVLQAFADRIIVVTQENRGLPAARNAGAARATGAWLAFLDADDLWQPEKLARQLEVASRANVALVYTDRFNIGQRGDLPEVQSQVQPLCSGDVFIDLLTCGNPITVSSVMLRTQVFRELGGFVEFLRAAEDWDLWLRLTAEHQIAVCAEPLVSYRFHGGMMSGDPRRMQVARRQVVRRALQSARGRGLPRHVRQQALAETARMNAWDAARRGARGMAWDEFARAIAASPFNRRTWRDLLRFLLGRIG